MREIPEMVKPDSFMGSVRHAPAREDVPEQFWDEASEFNKAAESWFAVGGEPVGPELRDGWILQIRSPRAGTCWLHHKSELTDTEVRNSLAVIRNILWSFELSHKQKIATAAYLLSEWFELEQKEG